MESFEVIIKKEMFKIIRSYEDSQAFNVFNHTTFHTIKRNDFGIWVEVEHRFGTERFPLDEIGDAIDQHYDGVVC
ncbi:hypothetical protein JN11_00210 [Mucilaginibacter frigoritolerans]|jgi:hypothetical protein|uniref:Uncharacterized protein n=1 Tax=Mucilaginibacter frigoritolerans TaxID=652788 RepID=A0A562UHE7_9SPHI|nr:hypothetical protein [Mucilaginibacter frigoritolerans]TWJ04501.1 hypothetical protein JN11_00210 [Mucilaginibacter frigoritolerans]